MASSMGFLTIAQFAPTDTYVDIYVTDLDQAYLNLYTGNVLWSAVDPTTNQAIQGVHFRQDKTGPASDTPLVVHGQIYVPREASGRVQIWAEYEKRNPNAPTLRFSYVLEFIIYADDPQDFGPLLGGMFVSSEWQPPLEADSNAPRCEFSVVLKDDSGAPIQGAEVQWRALANIVALTVMDAATGGNAVPPIPSSSAIYWWSTLTDPTGTARIYVQAPKTNTIQLYATTLGAHINPRQGQTYYVDLHDPSVDIDGQPLGIPGISNGWVDLPPGATCVTLQLPAIQSDYNLSSSQAWLWTETTTGKKDIPKTWSDVQEIQAGQVVCPPVADFTLNQALSNIAVIFVQRLDGDVYRSPGTLFGLRSQ